MNTLRHLSLTLGCALLAQGLGIGGAAAQSTPPLSQISFVRAGTTVRTSARPIDPKLTVLDQRGRVLDALIIGRGQPGKLNGGPSVKSDVVVSVAGCPPLLATCSTPLFLSGSSSPTRFDR